MAVSAMRRIAVAGPRGKLDDVMAALERAGALELTDVHGKAAGLGLKLGTGAAGDQTAHETLALVKYAVDYLNRLRRENVSMLDSFLGVKLGLTSAERDAVLSTCDFVKVVEACRAHDSQGNALRQEAARLQAELAEYGPWASLGVPVEVLRRAARARLRAGTTGSATALREALAAKVPDASVLVVNATPKRDYVVVACTAADAEACSDVLRDSDFSPQDFTGLVGRVDEAVRQAGQLEAANGAALADWYGRGQELTAYKTSLMVVYDHYLALASRADMGRCAAETRQAFFLEGWARAKDVPALKCAVSALDPDIAFVERAPEHGETPPVAMENTRAAAPVEVVTKMYGYPKYSEVDPTPVLGPFFILFFGMALGDAGYGLLLLALSAFALKRWQLSDGARKFFRLLAYCGLSSIVVGALMGSWFGNLVDKLPPAFAPVVAAKDAITLLNPQVDPTTMLLISLGLGFIQVVTGIGVKAYGNIRAGDARTALLDQVPWMFFLISGVLFGVSTQGVLAGAAPAFKYMAIGGALAVVATQGRAARNPLAKLGAGAYALYGSIGYLSDVLSYSRLLALGMAGGVIGQAINDIALMAGGVPLLGPVFVLVIMAGGHVFNLVLSVFGGFIHSARLQFVEFFTKFFEGGGKPFKPYQRQTRYTLLVE
ncbi:MAG: V-type ATP synthase subunit I [Bacillota bacterium]